MVSKFYLNEEYNYLSLLLFREIKNNFQAPFSKHILIFSAMTSFDKGMAILELNMAKLEKEMRFLSRAGNSKRTSKALF